MPFPFGKTVTFTPQTVDKYGDRTPGTPVDVAGCVVYGTPGVETPAHGDTVVYSVTVLAPPRTTVNTTDRVTIDGDVYEVSSQPVVWQHPITGTEPGVQFTARRVVG